MCLKCRGLLRDYENRWIVCSSSLNPRPPTPRQLAVAGVAELAATNKMYGLSSHAPFYGGRGSSLSDSTDSLPTAANCNHHNYQQVNNNCYCYTFENLPFIPLFGD